MNYRFTPRALKQFHKLPAAAQNELLQKIHYFLTADKPLNFAEPIVGEKHTHRFRVRDYRIIFTPGENSIVITKVGHRRDIYR